MERRWSPHSGLQPNGRGQLVTMEAGNCMMSSHSGPRTVGPCSIPGGNKAASLPGQDQELPSPFIELADIEAGQEALHRELPYQATAGMVETKRGHPSALRIKNAQLVAAGRQGSRHQ